MLEIPLVAEVDQRLVGLAVAELERVPHVVIERSDVRRFDRATLWIVVGFLAERIDGRSREARVESPRRAIAEHVLLEHAAGDAQVGPVEVVGRQSGVGMQLLDHRRATLRRQRVAGTERALVLPERELLHLAQERLELDRRSRQALVVPRRRGKGWQRQHVGLVDTRIKLGAIGAVVPNQPLREQHHAVEIERLVVLQQERQRTGASRPVALTENVLGRIPAAVARQELDDEVRERVRIRIDSPKRLLLIDAAQVAEAGTRSIDEHEVRLRQQRGTVVDHAIWRCRRMRVIERHDPLRPERAHVQPDRRAAGTAVEQERDRPGRVRILAEKIGEVRHAGFRLDRCRLVLARGRRVRIHRILDAHHQDAGFGPVTKRLAGDGQRAGAVRRFVLEMRRDGRFVHRLVRPGALVGHVGGDRNEWQAGERIGHVARDSVHR